ncbi:MAG: DegV family protein [Lachnospiraceae bacterium]|nr:DegV family protein [Lachnospiraceae bacterium]
MAYKIIGDSCTDITEEMKQEGFISLVPLTLTIKGETFVDDDTFNQKEFLAKMKQSEECPKSACPSPERYMREFEGQEECYVVTLSSRLSGSYNSAVLAKNMYLEEHPEAKIEIVDSKSASCGQMLLVVKLRELKEKGFGFEEVQKKITEFRDNMQTKFVLESLENLRKNGRLSKVAFTLCNVLNIRPVMAAEDGEIIKIDQTRGHNKALMRMIEYIEADATDVTNKIVGISHCNNRERAEMVKREILKRLPFKDCIIVDTAGVATLYANDGGIIVSY